MLPLALIILYIINTVVAMLVPTQTYLIKILANIKQKMAQTDLLSASVGSLLTVKYVQAATKAMINVYIL